MMQEKILLQKAAAGDLKAIKALAEYYDKNSGRWRNEPNVGEKISAEEFFANMDKKSDEDFLAEAFKWYLKGAELGEPECMYEVGRRIYDAIGCCKEEEWSERGKKSFEWYLKSAQAGYVPAMRITAYMYGGLCVEKNEVESFRWYLKAAKLGDKKSACEVVKCYAQGSGVEKNFDEADNWLDELDDEDYRETLLELSRGYDEDSLMWLERLVELGDPVALKRKAEAYCVGEGIEQNFEEALKLFIEAGTSEPGDYNPDVLAEALCQAGNLHYTGEGTIPQNYEQALKYYLMATRMHYVKAYILCGKMYYRGLGARKDYPKARRKFELAAKNRGRYIFSRPNNTVAVEYFGRMSELKKDFSKAYRYYELAAEDTRNQALIYRLANDYFYGNNVEPNVHKALGYYEEAGRYPNHEYFFEANLKLAWIYELGEFVDKDLAKADEYWAKLPPECKPARA